MRRVYLDNGATTPVDPRVVAAMLPHFSEVFGNASSLHSFGQAAKKAVSTARRQVADLIGADPNELVFTSGGTEADNLAVIGCAEAYAQAGRHVVTSAIEHPAVLKACAELERRGWRVTYIPVDSQGVIRLDDLRAALCRDTVLISVMHVNNEIGVVQPIAEIAELVAAERARGHAHLYLHTDAVQSAAKLPVDVRRLGVDLLSLSGHKFHGPKGAGALFVRKGVRLRQRQFGGHQERGRRPGTENVPAIVGLGAACALAMERLEFRQAHVADLRDRFEATLADRIPGVHLNGHPQLRVPHVSNVSFEGVEGEGLLIALDLQGIAVATGAACAAGATEPSHVLTALGLSAETIHGSLRFSFSELNTVEEVDYVLEVLPGIVARLRDNAVDTAGIGS